jgi:2-phospho-L-lactate transferase/gluconeogenesis factor (CofD/UPF0052 family)
MRRGGYFAVEPCRSKDPIYRYRGGAYNQAGDCGIPIISGQTVMVAAKMFAELGVEPSALAVCQHYPELLTGFVIDEEDQKLAQNVQGMGVKVFVTHTIMRSDEERQSLGEKVLGFAGEVRS